MGTLEQLNSRYIPGFSPGDDDGYITLCTHNSSAEAINKARLRGLPGKARRFIADLEGDFPEHGLPTASVLELKTGAQVMFIRNDMSADKAYFNGKIGKITRMRGDTIEVRCPGDSAEITAEKTTWENIEYTVDPETAEISQEVIGTFTQYPLKPAWAITIHKTQGLTFDKAVVYFEEKFSDVLSPWLEDFTVDTDNKEVRKQIRDVVKQLKEEAGQAPKAPTPVYSEADVGHPELFEKLREWRKRKASEEGVALYQVLHQKTLVQIAVHLPDSLAALKKIKGIGERLAARYGVELTTLVSDYRREHRIEEVSLPEPRP